MSITKQEVLDNLDEVKKYIEEAENKKEEKTIGIAIKNRFTGNIIFQSTKTVWKDAVEEANLLEADLIEADLSGANLSGANLSRANLSSADLSSADLSGADLSSADLSSANLSSAYLIGANLSEAYLSSANLSGANLSGANLSRANLSRANLIGAELNRALFYGKGGKVKLTKEQVPVFLAALGFVVEDKIGE